MELNKSDEVGNVRIKVIGVGGGGSNAVSRMYRERIAGVEYMVMNTDKQALLTSDVPTKLSIGDVLAEGKGVGGDPSKGALAAEANREEIAAAVRDQDMIFIAAGMGGGTGTGAAPVVARAAKDAEALTVGVVTRPFAFEGLHRARSAETGIRLLCEHVDTLLVIPNERLHLVCQEEVTAENAFDLADDVLRMGVQSIAELITGIGDINLDFADVQAVMQDSGPAWMSIGIGIGEKRAAMAAEEAITNHLLDVSIEGAKGVLLNVAGSEDLLLSELNEAAEVIKREVDPEANIIFGMVTNPKMGDQVRITLIATGFSGSETIIDPNSGMQDLLNAALLADESELDLPPFLRRTARSRRLEPAAATGFSWTF
jgi:cell division protein FtsZ